MNIKYQGTMSCIAAVILLFSLSSCRFQFPSASEGQELTKGGTFSGAPPAWVRQGEGEKPRIAANSGFIPESHFGTEATKISRQTVPGQEIDPQQFGYEIDGGPGETKDSSIAEDSPSAARLSEEERKSLSPLDRIEGVCPGVESAVTEALQTTNSTNRIQKYEALLSRCPSSSDLWLWLGKDYRSENNLIQANRCFEKVLTLDHDNEVARALLAEVRKSLNESQTQGGAVVRVAEMLGFTPLKLQPSVQHYAWGRKAVDSLIPKLIGVNPDEQTVPYAELWLGAHPSAPSQVLHDGKLIALNEFIARWPEEILGQSVYQRFGAQLPFLFKVLSIGAALSIQAHPDKILAEQLHSQDPQHYPDRNHKPEIAIALEPVHFLFGFRSLEEIASNLREVPEFRALIGSELFQRVSLEHADREIIRELYRTLMRQDAASIETQSQSLYQRLGNKASLSEEEQWILRLEKLFPAGDIGLFSFFVLNLDLLNPGEAVFIGPNTPHAYLAGELIECMANSDNVVRAGLTPKYRDVDTLIEMADVQKGRAEHRKGVSIHTVAQAKKYQTPAEEFLIEQYDGTIEQLGSKEEPGVELLFCLEGRGSLSANDCTLEFSSGEAYLIPAALGQYSFSLFDGTLFRVRVP